MSNLPEITSQASELFMQHLPEGWTERDGEFYDEENDGVASDWKRVAGVVKDIMLRNPGKVTIDSWMRDEGVLNVWATFTSATNDHGGVGISNSNQCEDPEADAIIRAWCHWKILTQQSAGGAA